MSQTNSFLCVFVTSDRKQHSRFPPDLAVPGPILRTQELTDRFPMACFVTGASSRSSTFRKLSGNRTYISTTRRITSGDELK